METPRIAEVANEAPQLHRPFLYIVGPQALNGSIITYPNAEIGAATHQNIRQIVGQGVFKVEEADHTSASPNWYQDLYYWDSGFSVIVGARAGKHWLKAAQREIQALLKGVQPNGFMPNQQFLVPNDERLLRRRLDPERLLGFERDAQTSNYSQPPVLALAIAETYQAIANDRVTRNGSAYTDAQEFLRSAYDKVKAHYLFWERERTDGPEDKLIAIIHPHETGRDSDPTFDHLKWRVPRFRIQNQVIMDKLNLPIDKINSPLDYGSIVIHGLRLKAAGEDIQKIQELCWIKDVMMQCIYNDNVRITAELATQAGHPEDATDFSKLADEAEQQILTEMWFPEARGGKGAFYALNKDGSPIEEISISNLFPLVLPHLSEEQLESLLGLMDGSFNVPFPLPSVATDSRNYDPHRREWDRLWRGPTWIPTNWYLVERGLRLQLSRADLAHRPDLLERCDRWANRTARSSRVLVDTDDPKGPREHYDPVTGAAQRLRVEIFAMSALAHAM
jgi:mannosylglycerate hydrolase MGH1-like protein